MANKINKEGGVHSQHPYDPAKRENLNKKKEINEKKPFPGFKPGPF
jgi:hypothetical protein